MSTAVQDSTTTTARFFRVLGDPTRLRIIASLLDGPKSVTELVNITGSSQSRVSTHLACLRWCCFVGTERQGRHVIYSISDPDLGPLLQSAGLLSAAKHEHLATCTRIGPDWA